MDYLICGYNIFACSFLATSGLMRSRDGGEGRLQLEELSSSTTESTSPRQERVLGYGGRGGGGGVDVDDAATV